MPSYCQGLPKGMNYRFSFLILWIYRRRGKLNWCLIPVLKLLFWSSSYILLLSGDKGILHATKWWWKDCSSYGYVGSPGKLGQIISCVLCIVSCRNILLPFLRLNYCYWICVKSFLIPNYFFEEKKNIWCYTGFTQHKNACFGSIKLQNSRNTEEEQSKTPRLGLAINPFDIDV